MICVMSGVASAESKTEKTEKVEKAEEAPLYSVEVSVGKGVEMGGGGEMTATKIAPMTLEGVVSIAIREEPLVYAYGGLTAELINRNAVGAVAGLQVPVKGTPIRLSGGATYLFAPYTLWGASAAVGGCARGKFGQLGICGDIEMTAFFAGTDLPDGRTLTQIQARLGVSFDAF